VVKFLAIGVLCLYGSKMFLGEFKIFYWSFAQHITVMYFIVHDAHRSRFIVNTCSLFSRQISAIISLESRQFPGNQPGILSTQNRTATVRLRLWNGSCSITSHYCIRTQYTYRHCIILNRIRWKRKYKIYILYYIIIYIHRYLYACNSNNNTHFMYNCRRSGRQCTIKHRPFHIIYTLRHIGYVII